jgi:hypothetical protein
MLGRLLVAGGMCWLDVKPTDLPGDRFELCALVVNLTGQGNCARQMTLGAGKWALEPVEVNLETLDARAVLEDIASGKAPREVLALVSLMKNGDDPDTIKRWREVADPETDLGRRGDYALVVLFAGAVGRREVWRKALESFQMNESPVAREWRAEARREGKIEGRIDSLLLALEGRFGAVPEELASQVRSSVDGAQLAGWLRLAVSPAISTLEMFRQRAGL